MADSSRAARPKVLIAMEPVVAGTLRHLEDLLAHADPNEFDLHLAVSAERDPSVRERFEAWRGAGRVVHEVPMRREVAPWRDARAFVRLLALCRRERYDVVHTHCAKAGFLGRLAARLSGARTVHTPHVFPFGRGGGALAERLYLALERRAARWTDRLVVLSRYQRNLALWRRLTPPAQAVLIPNGIDRDRLPPRDRVAARRSLGIEPDATVVLALGRLSRQKGLDVLVEAAGLAAGQGTGCPLILIVGAGEEGDPLQGLVRRLGVQDVVQLMGPTDDAATHYAACDLVVLPSRYEGMPYVLLEARAAGRPVAVSLVSGMEEFVRPAGGGILVPAGDPRVLAGLLSAQCAGGGDRRAAQRRAPARQWTAAEAVTKLLGVYRELAAPTPGRA